MLYNWLCTSWLVIERNDATSCIHYMYLRTAMVYGIPSIRQYFVDWNVQSQRPRKWQLIAVFIRCGLI